MGGLFGDVFGDDWDDVDDDANTKEESSDEWKSDVWATGAKQDNWTTDEPWTSELTPEEEEEKESFDLSDFFN